MSDRHQVRVTVEKKGPGQKNMFQPITGLFAGGFFLCHYIRLGVVLGTTPDPTDSGRNDVPKPLTNEKPKHCPVWLLARITQID
jgi:hypothetical protein